MLFDNDLKDNLIMNGDGGRKRRGLKLIILAVLIAAAAAVLWGRGMLRRIRPEPEQVVIAEPMPETIDIADPGMQLLTQVRTLHDSRDLVAARDKGLELLGASSDPHAVEEAKKLLGEINIELVQTPLAMPEKENYLVKPGDSLERIAKNFGTTVELIGKSNTIRSSMIHPGDVLRVFKGTFLITVNKSRNDLLLTMNDKFFKRYRVGTGKHGTTPVGVFEIADKIVEPPWWRPDGKVLAFGDEGNVLGTRWMSMGAIEDTEKVRGYGIHGTWEPETIGYQESQGCIRMLNDDVEELFMLVPMGTRIVVEE